jgi:thyroid hormone receptor-associated protein 3
LPKRFKFQDDFKKMADFQKEEMDDQDKDKNKSREEPEFDGEPRLMSKVIANTSKNQEEVRQEGEPARNEGKDAGSRGAGGEAFHGKILK